MNSIYRRASAYYKKHGLNRSLRLIYRKATGKVPWNLRQPRKSSEAYIADYRKVVVNNAAAKPEFGRVLNDEAELGLARPVVTMPRPASEIFGSGNVAIIGDLNLPQCKKYRVIQKVEALQQMGLSANFSHWQDIPRCINLLQTATCLVLYRVQNNSLIEQYCAEAQRLGLPVGYDIDDPVFDKPTYSANENLNALDPAEKADLLSTCGFYAEAFQLADFVIVSTPGMAEVAKKHFSGPIHLWRNAIDLETRQAALRYVLFGRKQQGDKVRIGYASGSRAHNADFAVAEDSLIKVLAEHPQTELHIVGYHEPSKRLDVYSDRITQIPFQDYPTYIENVSQFDISLVPLLPDAFNDCKSAIRYLESSIVGVPAIATDIGDFSYLIDSGVNGFLAASDRDWHEMLSALVADPALREKTGTAARDYVTREMLSETVAAGLDAPLLRILRNA